MVNRSPMLERPSVLAAIDEYFGVHPAVTLSGPRQCGKTTLAREFAARTPHATFFDLEDAADRQKLAEPEQTLKPLTGLVVIDEIQRQPALFETLRVLLDRRHDVAPISRSRSARPPDRRHDVVQRPRAGRRRQQPPGRQGRAAPGRAGGPSPERAPGALGCSRALRARRR